MAASGGFSKLYFGQACQEIRPPVADVFARYYLAARADIDSDENGIPDARERFVLGADANNTANQSASALLQESTGTTIPDTNSFLSVSNAVPVPCAVLKGRIIYVDYKKGADTLTGRAPVIIGADGPKKTIKAGLKSADAGATMIIRSGNYGEDLNIAGRSISVRIEGSVNLSGKSRAVSAPVPMITNTWPISGVATNGG